MNKYDWSQVPQEVKFIATEPGDFEIWFLTKPNAGTGFGWFGGDEHSTHSPSSYSGDWKESLEQRPEEQSQ